MNTLYMLKKQDKDTMDISIGTISIKDAPFPIININKLNSITYKTVGMEL